jgi:hypothetical protein
MSARSPSTGKWSAFDGGFAMPKPRYRSPPEILSKPIKAYKFSADECDQKVSAEVEKRINAAVEYFGIPAGQYKWEILSLVLLRRVFPDGFTVLDEPRGGAKKNPADAYCDLADKFDRFIGKNPHLSESAQAKNLIKSGVKVGKETITTSKGLLRAVRRGRAERQQRYTEQLLIRYGMQLAMAGADYGPMNARPPPSEKNRTP